MSLLPSKVKQEANKYFSGFTAISSLFVALHTVSPHVMLLVGSASVRKMTHNEANFTIDWYKQELCSYDLSSVLYEMMLNESTFFLRTCCSFIRSSGKKKSKERGREGGLNKSKRNWRGKKRERERFYSDNNLQIASCRNQKCAWWRQKRGHLL